MKNLLLLLALTISLGLNAQNNKDIAPNETHHAERILDSFADSFIDEGVREGVSVLGQDDWQMIYDYASTGNNYIGAIRYNDKIWEAYDFPGFKVVSVNYRGTTIHFFTKLTNEEKRATEG